MRSLHEIRLVRTIAHQPKSDLIGVAFLPEESGRVQNGSADAEGALDDEGGQGVRQDAQEEDAKVAGAQGALEYELPFLSSVRQ